MNDKTNSANCYSGRTDERTDTVIGRGSFERDKKKQVKAEMKENRVSKILIKIIHVLYYEY